ncbi:MAG: hypothetical protein ABEH81_04010 [Halopenitus sp.]
MAEFGVAATLEVTVPDRELRAARQKIEDELGDVTVGVDASTSGSSGRGGGGRMAGRERAMSRQLLSEANRLKESNIDLDEQRNALLEELIDTTEDGDYSRARSGGALGSAAIGIGVAGAIGAGIVSKLKNFEFDPVPLDKPPWIPIPVKPPSEPKSPKDAPNGEPTGGPSGDPTGQPGPLPSPGPGPTPTGPNDNPTGNSDPSPDPNPNPGPGPVPIPPSAPNDDPGPTSGPGPGPVAFGPNDGPAPEPAPSPTPDREPDEFLDRPSRKEVVVGGSAAISAAAGAKLLQGVPKPGVTGSGIGVPAAGAAAVAQTANQARREDRKERGPIEQKLLDILRNAGIGQQTASMSVDVTNEVDVGASTQELERKLERAKQEVLRKVKQQGNGGVI